MPSWKKLLSQSQMVSDENPCTYTYDDAARVLGHLGFEVAPSSGGSHRKWRLKLSDRTLVIGLVDSGRGTMKKVYILDMVQKLRANELIPEWVEQADELDTRAEDRGAASTPVDNPNDKK